MGENDTLFTLAMADDARFGWFIAGTFIRNHCVLPQPPQSNQPLNLPTPHAFHHDDDRKLVQIDTNHFCS